MYPARGTALISSEPLARQTTIEHMKYLKLILLGLMFVASFLVIGNFSLRTIAYPLLSIYLLFLAYNSLKVKSPLWLGNLLALLGFCYLLFTIFSGCGFVLCAYGQRQTEYINRKKPNITIVGRDYSCFGTTGDLVLYKTYSLSDNVALEIYYKTFPDYKNVDVDTTIWKRINTY
jgi:hypothetical protein